MSTLPDPTAPDVPGERVSCPVVHRLFVDPRKYWETTGLADDVYAVGTSLDEVTASITESLALDRGVDERRISLVEFVEHLVVAASDAHPAVYVRRRRDDIEHPQRHVQLMEWGEQVKKIVESFDPADVFGDELARARSGDVIVAAVLPDDVIADVTTLVGSSGRVFACVPVGQYAAMLSVVTDAAPTTSGDEVPLSSLGVSPTDPMSALINASAGLTPQQRLSGIALSR